MKPFSFAAPPEWQVQARVAILQIARQRKVKDATIRRAWAAVDAIEADDLPVPQVRPGAARDILLHFVAPSGRHLMLHATPTHVLATRWTTNTPGRQSLLERGGVQQLRHFADWLTFHEMTHRPPTLTETLAEIDPS
jgi:hypothetical protein